MEYEDQNGEEISEENRVEEEKSKMVYRNLIITFLFIVYLAIFIKFLFF